MMTVPSASIVDTTDTRHLVTVFRDTQERIREQVRRVIVGQEDVVEHLLLTLLVGGHCLITGMPGTAKTLLVRTLATALGLTFKRIQFTPDLMPSQEEDASRPWGLMIPKPVTKTLFRSLSIYRNINNAD